MIEIKFTQVENMQPVTLRNVAGMFEVLAQYAEKLSAAKEPDSMQFIKQATEFAESVIPKEQQNQMVSPAAVFQPPVAPVVPVPPVVSPVIPQAAGIDVDAAGMPWDGRIHSSSKAKIADGTWRQKRNLDPELLTKVTAELKQTMGAPTPPAAPAQVPPAPFVEPAVALAPAPTNSIPVAPAIPVPPAPTGAATTASPSSSSNGFLTLMKGITAGYASGTITQAAINAAVQKVGLPSLPMLAQRPELVAQVATELGVAV